MADLQELFTQSVINQKKGDLQTAIEQINAILISNPDFPPGWNNRGTMLRELGHPFDAALCFEKAIHYGPDEGAHYSNRGACYIELGLFEKAIEDFKTASIKSPKLKEAKNNLGNVYMLMNRCAEATQAYREGVKIDPDYADCHLGVATSLLKQGKFEEGWKQFEWRWKTNQLVRRNLPYPEWNGERAQSVDDILLLYGEQGLGDDIQFMRYAPWVKKLAWHGKVYVELRQPVVRLAQTLKGIDGVITLGEKPPEGIRAMAPLMSCPRILWETIEDTPSKCPYVHPDPYRTAVWREKLKALPAAPLVGLCWAGMNRQHIAAASSIDSRRSMSLPDFAPLAQIQPISWVSLQCGPPASQLMQRPSGMSIGDWSAEMYDFYDTAALIEALDLVITVDTSVAHVAGAIGKPTWLLSRFDGCWRWLMDHEDTEWYPSMKIYRQKKPYDWSVPLEQMEHDLRNFIQTKIVQ